MTFEFEPTTAIDGQSSTGQLHSDVATALASGPSLHCPVPTGLGKEKIYFLNSPLFILTRIEQGAMWYENPGGDVKGTTVSPAGIGGLDVYPNLSQRPELLPKGPAGVYPHFQAYWPGGENHVQDAVRCLTGKIWAKFIDLGKGHDLGNKELTFIDNPFTRWPSEVDQWKLDWNMAKSVKETLFVSFMSSVQGDGLPSQLNIYTKGPLGGDHFTGVITSPMLAGPSDVVVANDQPVLYYTPFQRIDTGEDNLQDVLQLIANGGWHEDIAPGDGAVIQTSYPTIFGLAGTSMQSDGVPYNIEAMILTTDVSPEHPSNFTGPHPYSFEGSVFQRIIDSVDVLNNPSLPKNGGGPGKEAWAQVRTIKQDHCFIYTDTPQPPYLAAPTAGATPYVSVTPNYNYYLDTYEQLINPNTIPEAALPSLLITAAEEIAPPLSSLAAISSFWLAAAYNAAVAYHHFLTLDGKVTDVFLDLLNKWVFKDKKEAFDYINTSVEQDRTQYFEQWVNAIKAMPPDDLTTLMSELENKWKNQIILQSSDNIITNGYAPRKHMFPMETTIKIGTASSAKQHNLLRLLNEHDLTYALLKTIKERITGEAASPELLSRFWTFEDGNMGSRFDYYNTTTDEQFNEVPRSWYPELGPLQNSLRFYGQAYLPYGPKIEGSPIASTWFEAFKNDGNGIFIGGNPVITPIIPSAEDPNDWPTIEDIEMATDPNYIDFDVNIESFQEDLNELLRHQTRTYQEIIQGQMACTETLFWRIQKFKITRDENGEITATTPIQNFFIVDPIELDEIEFVDTQLKYGHEYAYKIYEWRAIFGTEYTYVYPKAEFTESTMVPPNLGTIPPPDEWGDTPPVIPDLSTISPTVNYPTQKYTDSEDHTTDPWQLVLHTVSKPSIKIVEIPVYKSPSYFVLDRPPLPPDVEFVPYAGIDNTYLILLNAGIGSIKKFIAPPPGAPPYSGLAIFEEDIPSFQNAINNQILSGINIALSPWEQEELLSNLIFESDDRPSSFEIFVIGPDPETGITTPPKSYFDFAKGQKIDLELKEVTSSSYRPIIKPNQKYYYTFRARDVHGHMSYPSLVYEVQSINDSGAVYLETNVYKFPAPERMLKKPMRKFLNITPALEQATVTPSFFEDNKASTYAKKSPSFGVTQIQRRLFDNDTSYKIRLTSKNSGKKMDFNINFKSTKKDTMFDTMWLPGGIPNPWGVWTPAGKTPSKWMQSAFQPSPGLISGQSPGVGPSAVGGAGDAPWPD